ncbi:hypothetical protein OKW34_002349 [Paraburkholderia youngii]|uniref:hypothetical protein n=1 Tax=Paraburkholderia youngii TaxID=2782701 RepID=UPI003D22E93A
MREGELFHTNDRHYGRETRHVTDPRDAFAAERERKTSMRSSAIASAEHWRAVQ